MRPLRTLCVADPARSETAEKIPFNGDSRFSLGTRGWERFRVRLLEGGEKPTEHLRRCTWRAVTASPRLGDGETEAAARRERSSAGGWEKEEGL